MKIVEVDLRFGCILLKWLDAHARRFIFECFDLGLHHGDVELRLDACRVGVCRMDVDRI